MKTRKVLIFCKVKWKKAMKEMRDKKATEDDDIPGMYSHFWEKMVSI
jgi:hypothetical protein